MPLPLVIKLFAYTVCHSITGERLNSTGHILSIKQYIKRHYFSFLNHHCLFMLIFIVCLCVSIGSSFTVLAQGGGRPPGGNDGMGMPGGRGGGRHGGGNIPGMGQESSADQLNQRPKIGRATGEVVDANTGEPLAYAVVSIINPSDTTIVTGAVTNKDGKFSVKNIPVGKYIIRIKFIGYRSAKNDSLLITPRNPLKDFGTIRLKPQEIATNEVEITAKRETITSSIDKKVFEVDETVATIGGSATDVLQQVPSISVDMNNSIQLRGSGGVTVLIDGRPSSLTGANRDAVLDNIPANAIERIEVVTNPSAKYDAEGMSGIINIVLKKGGVVGFNTTVTGSVGTRDKYNGSINSNWRNNNVNIFGSYNFRYDDIFNNGSLDRTSEIGNNTITLNQRNDGGNISRSHTINTGMDYYISEEQNLSLSLTGNIPNGIRDEMITYQNSQTSGGILPQFSRGSINSNDGSGYDASLNYKYTFAPRHEFTASVSTSMNENTSAQNFTQLFTQPDSLLLQRQNRMVNNRTTIIQTDYVKAFDNGGSFEGGYKSTIRRIDNNFIFEDFFGNAWVNNPGITNNFIFDENIHALYATYQGIVGDFGYKIGLRAEQTLTNSLQKVNNEEYENNYFNVFPSAFLTYRPTLTQQWQLSFSRRINRPDYESLNPFRDVSDIVTIRTGNPFLQPEFTNAYEVSFANDYEWLYVTTSVYYRRTDDMQNRIITTDSVNRSLVTFANFNHRTNIGLEVVSRFQFSQGWDATATLNMFNTSVDGNVNNTAFANQNNSWSLQVMSNIDLEDICKIQISGNYVAPVATPQGQFYGFSGINIGARKELFDGKLSVALNVSDIFDTRRFQMDLNSLNFTQEFIRKRETRIGTLAFTWKFGTFFGDEAQQQRRRARDFNSGERFDSF